ncbi:serine/threonine/dual specificity protein kinase, catalytic domain-containing protein [Artemisia annua]|uniref:Serine/threonine/dual specificity protein kinase, catalytic domain-containing protein n=1 Tax=Artemisia annua TaxID=35608 RepID=A0A2U1LGL9_ARTAN|nr:serine/threonine/dual specificity protein kinase, catalytic domain-containing protein [Artemisia annua]
MGLLVEDKSYKDDVESGVPYFISDSRWGFSNTGHFLDGDQCDSYIVRSALPNSSELYTSEQSLHFADIMFTDGGEYSSLGSQTQYLHSGEAGKVVGGWESGCEKLYCKCCGYFEIRLYWVGKGTINIPSRGIYGPLISVNPTQYLKCLCADLMEKFQPGIQILFVNNGDGRITGDDATNSKRQRYLGFKEFIIAMHTTSDFDAKPMMMLLDFGMIGEFREELRDGFIESCIHLINRYYDSLAKDFVTLRLLPATADKVEVTKALTVKKIGQQLLDTLRRDVVVVEVDNSNDGATGASCISQSNEENVVDLQLSLWNDVDKKHVGSEMFDKKWTKRDQEIDLGGNLMIYSKKVVGDEVKNIGDWLSWPTYMEGEASNGWFLQMTDSLDKIDKVFNQLMHIEFVPM